MSPAGAWSKTHCTAGVNTPGRGSMVHDVSVCPVANGAHRPATQRMSLAQPVVAVHDPSTVTHAPARHTEPEGQSALARQRAPASDGVPASNTEASARASIGGVGTSIVGRPASTRASIAPASRPPSGTVTPTVSSGAHAASRAIANATPPVLRAASIGSASVHRPP